MKTYKITVIIKALNKDDAEATVYNALADNDVMVGSATSIGGAKS